MNKEQKVAIIAAMLPCLVFGGAFIQVYVSHQEHEAVFKVFLVDVWPPENGKTITQILTWGDGKYQFIGDWSNQFEADHSYHVVYVQKAGHSKHSYSNLIILEWSDIS